MNQSVWIKPLLKPYALAAIPLLLVAGAVSLAVHADDVFARPVDGVQTLVFLRHAEKPADGPR
ncbi:histidine phosphatase family protein, partial [Pseudomonas fragi]